MAGMFLPLKNQLKHMMNNIPIIDIRVKRIHPLAKLPEKKRNSDMGWDIFCIPDEEWDISKFQKTPYYVLHPGNSHTFRTGIKIELPPNYGFLLRDRSSLGTKDITVLAGVIEGTYRGEYLIHLINLSDKVHMFQSGDKIAQAILTEILPAYVVEVDELSETDRGEKGFGSSGR